METSALSGNITTQYFGEKFNATNIDAGDVNIHLHIHSPISFSQKDDNRINITLQFSIEKVTMTEYSDKDRLILSEFESLDPIVNHISRNISISKLNSDKIIVENKRRVTEEDIRNLKLNQMPGFQLTWHYHESLVAYKMNEHDSFKQTLVTKMFTRYRS